MRRWFAYCTCYNIAWYYGFYKITAFLANLFKWRIFGIFFILLCKLFPIVALLYSRGFKQTWIYTTLGCYKPGWHITSVNMYTIYVRTRCSLYCESRSVGKRFCKITDLTKFCGVTSIFFFKYLLQCNQCRQFMCE